MISYYLPSESKIGVGYQVHALANELCRPRPRRDGPQRVRTRPRRPLRPSARPPSRQSAHVPVRHAAAPARPVVVRRAARPRRRLLDVAAARAARTCARSTGRASRRPCTSAGAVERTRMVHARASARCWRASSPTRPWSSHPPTRRWTPWVRTVIPNGVEPAARSGRRRAVGAPHRAVRRHVGGAQARPDARRRVRRARPARVCPTPSSGWSRETSRTDVPPQVKRLGRVSDEELARLYARAWVFCLPSSYEGFGIPYAEAMSAGLPVVATPKPRVSLRHRRGPKRAARRRRPCRSGAAGPAARRLPPDGVREGWPRPRRALLARPRRVLLRAALP